MFCSGVNAELTLKTSYFSAHLAEAGQARSSPSLPCPHPPPRRGGSGRNGN